MKKSEFIRRELGRINPVDFSNPEQAKILCPWHADTNPSMDVRLRPKTKMREGKPIVIGIGTFNCWSCKAHGPWNKLALKLGLEQWDEQKVEEYEDQPDNPFYALAQDLEGIAKAEQEYVKPVTDGPWEGDWRGLTGAFLRSQGAESQWDKEHGEYRVFLPIHDAFGKLAGHVACRGPNSQIPDKKKYMNSKGFNGAGIWYGLDRIENPKIVVIVEGPFDRLRLASHGIPAIANLGVQLREDAESTVSDEKVMQLLARGCAKVILALDADEAGRAAVAGFTASFQKWGFEVFDLNLSRYAKPDEKMDPGNCPMEVIEDLKAFIGSLR